MRLAQFDVGDRRFFLPAENIESVMAQAARARERGEWLEFRDTGGDLVRLLIPSHVLLALREYEAEPGIRVEPDANDWAGFDYDI